LLCHLTKEEVRDNTFKNFNLQISPISINELKNFESLPIGYEDIINLKNTNIINNSQNVLEQIGSIRDIIFDNKSYEDLINTNNYINK
jgi:hypothetical protein